LEDCFTSEQVRIVQLFSKAQIRSGIFIMLQDRISWYFNFFFPHMMSFILFKSSDSWSYMI